jgi:hypothetical protein
MSVVYGDVQGPMAYGSILQTRDCRLVIADFQALKAAGEAKIEGVG